MNKNELNREYKLILCQDGTISIYRLSDNKVIYLKKWEDGESLKENLDEAVYLWLGLSSGRIDYADLK